MQEEISLKEISMEELEILMDTLVFTIPEFKSWLKENQVKKLKESFNVNVVERDLYILEDTTLKDDILEKKLMLHNLNLNNGRNEEELYDDSTGVYGGNQTYLE